MIFISEFIGTTAPSEPLPNNGVILRQGMDGE